MPTQAELESRRLLDARGVSRVIATGQESGDALRRGKENWVTATGSSTPRTLADWMAQVDSFATVNAGDPRYGLVGDGSADDTGPVEAAVAALVATDYGGILRFPAGRFRLTERISIPKVSGKSFIIEGAGEATRFEIDADSSRAGFYVGSGSAGGTCRTILRDFMLTGDQTNAYGFDLENANGLIVKNVRLDTLQRGFLAISSFGCRFEKIYGYLVAQEMFRWATGGANNCIWDKCGIFNCGGSTYPVWHLAAATRNAVFTNNDLEVIGQVLNTDAELTALTFDGNFVEASALKMFDFQAATHGSISRNVFSQSEDSEIDNFQAGSKFNGNWLFDQIISWGSGTGNIEIEGNRLSSSTLPTNAVENGDSTFTIPRYANTAITTASLSAPRAWTIRPASDYETGATIRIIDAAGAINGANNIVVTRSGSDTINGATTYLFNESRGTVTLTKTGDTTWSAVTQMAGGRVIILGQSAVAAPHTGDTNETVLATISVPAGAMGANGRIRISTLWTANNDASAKLVRVRLGGIGGTIYGQVTLANVNTGRISVEIANRNSANSQVGNTYMGTGGWGTTTTAVVTGAVNTAAATTIVLTVELADSADTVTLESYCVELMPAT